MILNVEDFPASRYLRSKVLRNAGFAVLEADSADEAIRMATTDAPDLALVDVDLPDGNGFNLCEALKRAYLTMPVLLISAVHVSAWDRNAAEETCADDYLIEPLPAATLVSRVRAALHGIPRQESPNWVVTDAGGMILDVSAAAAHMLALSAAHLRRRKSLVLFFEENREQWQHELALATDGQIVRRNGRLRPRDRRPIDVNVEIAAEPNAPRGTEIRWIFTAPEGS